MRENGEGGEKREDAGGKGRKKGREKEEEVDLQ